VHPLDGRRGPFNFGGAGGTPAQAVTDAGGRWSFDALPAGTLRFAASDDHHAPGTSEPVPPDGKTGRDGGIIHLRARGHVAGQAARPDGMPVASATIRVGARGEGARTAYSDEHGNFDIAGLPHQPITLVAAGESASSEPVPLDLSAKPEQLG